MINTLMEALDKENINVFRLVLMNRDDSFEKADRLPTTRRENITHTQIPLFICFPSL